MGFVGTFEHGTMLKVAIMLLSPPKYLFSIKIEISAIVLIQNGLEMDPFSVML